MKILWITNLLFPEAVEAISGHSNMNASGGWLIGAAKMLSINREIELAVGSVSTLVDDYSVVMGEHIKYYIIPYGKGNNTINHTYEPYWLRVNEDFNPDIVHIHGTELSHGLAFIEACGASNVIVSVQGLTSEISKYYTAGLSFREILSSITWREIIKGSIYHERYLFKKRGEFEKELLQRINFVIGRTSWDKAHVMAINPKLHYFSCNETLRDVFYDGEKWKIDRCERFSIFLSQGTYPIKGAHIAMKAMPLVLARYPKAKLRIAGSNIVKKDKGIAGLLKWTGYGRYLKQLITKLRIENSVSFLGSLNASEMKAEYLNCNIFLCPSSIENSPNSIGEAQILGVPVIASFAGGIPDMMKGQENRLYRFDDVAMLSNKINDLLGENEITNTMLPVAQKRHDPKVNCETTIRIYQTVLDLINKG